MRSRATCGPFASLRPDNPLTESGVLGELSHHPVSSRIGQKRADLGHLPLDPIIVAGPWLLAVGVVVAGVRRLARLRTP